MKARDAVIAWTPANWPADHPTKGEVKVGPAATGTGRPDRWSKPYRMLIRAARGENYRQLTDQDKITGQVFIDFNTLIVRDGINPQTAHREFLNIDEYAEAVSPDIPGAREPQD